MILFGATGTIGKRIFAEAIRRGHQVTVFVRDASKVAPGAKPARVIEGNVNFPEQVTDAARGHEIAISALGPRADAPYEIVDLYKSLIAGLRQAGVGRLVVVGGAGSLQTPDGVRLFDSPTFPKEWLGVAKAHGEVLELLKDSELDWTYISPPALIQPGERTGKYRRGENQLLFDAQGKSQISDEDYAIALLDEVETAQARRKRITVTMCPGNARRSGHSQHGLTRGGRERCRRPAHARVSLVPEFA